VVIEELDEGEARWIEWINAQSGVATPGCNCGHTGMGVAWHVTECPGAHRALMAMARRAITGETGHG
jgi:hypothetical protein